jgi:hypothetical protein
MSMAEREVAGGSSGAAYGTRAFFRRFELGGSDGKGAFVFEIPVEGELIENESMAMVVELCGAAAGKDDCSLCYGSASLLFAAVERGRLAGMEMGDMEWCESLYGDVGAGERDYIRPVVRRDLVANGAQAVFGRTLAVRAGSGLCDVRGEATTMPNAYLPGTGLKDVCWIVCVTYWAVGAQSFDVYARGSVRQGVKRREVAEHRQRGLVMGGGHRAVARVQ